jgi:Rieske 2Fe-2S family protein
MPLSSHLQSQLRETVREHLEARQLPREAYVDEAVLALDQATFLRSWLPVCHVSELASAGAYFALEALGERVLVVRGADLQLRAFFDRCRHRGTPLTEGESGRLARLEVRCPYHGLTYDLRGRADAAHARTLGLVQPELEPAPLAVRWGFVFVACEQAPSPLSDEPAPPWLDRASLHAVRLLRRTHHEVGANWKLLIQNFQESHHFGTVHPTLERRTPSSRSESHDFGGRFLGGTMRLEDDVETVSESGRLLGRPFVAAVEDRRVVRDALLFPGWLTSLQPDYFLSYRVVPVAPARTRVVAEIYVHAEAPDDAAGDVLNFWDRTNAEDRAICERQQRGVAAPSYVPGPYAPSEDGMHAFDRRIARAYLSHAEEP